MSRRRSRERSEQGRRALERPLTGTIAPHPRADRDDPVRHDPAVPAPRTARVVPLVTTRALREPLDYLQPEGIELEPGDVVYVPLAGRSVRGVVVEAGGPSQHEGALAVVERLGEEPRIAPLVLELCLWIARYYGSTPARALALALPPRVRAPRDTWVSATGAPGTTERRRALLAELAGGPLPLPELVARARTTAATVRRLAEDGLVQLDARLRVPTVRAGRTPPPESLTDAQSAAVARIEELLEAGGGNLLLYGVTGSGKTEVYLRAAESALARGRTVLVLVPEIALSPQTARRFAARFGEQVAVLHSGISDGERRAVREAAMAGDVRVVVGARSAVFAPLPDIGLIVVDEEHESAYKQGDDPRYDARRVAAKRARLEGAVLVLGSATPRPESWARLPRATLPARVGGDLPRVEVVDLRRDGLYPLSRPLRSGLVRLADEGGRAILLLNRRGEAPALHCRSCGEGFRCERCDVSLALHAGGRLRCHHCGYTQRAPSECPHCGSVELARLGAGTERVSEAVSELLPHVPVLRLDADATERRGSLDATLERFASEPAAVLVGTQMVAKGHDFRDLRLAAAIDADQGLAWPDFRSEERTFGLLAQLAGRSGRRGDPGSVIFQAWDPDQRVVRLAAEHAVEAFLAGELERRERLGYPPFRHLVRVEVAAGEPGAAMEALAALRAAAEPALPGDEVLGPAPLFRVRGRERAQLLVKTLHPSRAGSMLAELVARQGRALRRANASAVVDVDPQ
jgi:primosomal protein N' (replication factor Y) (superfamily II helicase)